MDAEKTVTNPEPAKSDEHDDEHMLNVKSEQLDSVAKAMARLGELGEHDIVAGLAYVAESLAADVKRLVMRAPAA